MADKISQANNLYVGLTDSQDKLKTFKLPNPQEDLEETDVRTAVATFLNAGVYDSSGVQFSSTNITTAYYEDVEKIELDIS